MASVPELIKWLERRLDAFAEGDLQQVLDEQVLAVANELRARRITDIEQAGSACTAIATLHLSRASALEGNERRAETIRCAGLYATIAQIRPDLVPPNVWGLIAQDSDPSARVESRLRDLRDHAIGSGDAAALSLAAALFRELASRPEGARLEDLASLAEILWVRADLLRDIGDLDEAVAVGQTWLEGASESHIERAFRLWRIGLAEFARSLILSDPSHLDQAITCFRTAVAAASGDDPKLQSYFSDLALSLNQRATITNRIEDVDAAIEGWKRALKSAPSGLHTDRGTYKFNLGSMFWQRFETTGEQADLDAAIASWSVALDHFPVGHQYNGVVASLLAEGLRVRSDRNGAVADADESIRVVRTLIDIGGSGEEPAKTLSILGNAHWTRYSIVGEATDLEQAIAASRNAVEQTPPASPFLCQRTSNLSRNLLAQYQRTSRLRDIVEAADLARTSVRSMPVDMKSPGPILSNAGNALRKLAERTGDVTDLEAATALLRKAVDSFRSTDFQRAAAFFNLTITLQYQAEQTGDLEMIDEAVAVGRQALRETPDGGPYLAGYFGNLASAFRARYLLTGDASDLDEAVDAADEALNRTPVTHRSRAVRANTLATVLVARFQRFRERDALDEAIILGREAVELTPAAHADRAVPCTNLAGAHLHRYLSADDGRDLTDLAAAVSLAREAVAATPEDDPFRAVALMNLGEMLHRRFTALSDEHDLEQATALAREALARAPEDSPNRSNIHWLLGKILSNQSESIGDETSDSEAVASFAAAAAIPTGPVTLRIRAASIAARTLMLQGESASAQALPMLQEAIQLLPRLTRHGLDRGDRRHLLEEEAATLSADAAACALNVGDSAKAVRLLEQGRGIVWGQLLDLRSDRDMLHEAYPELAAELEHCLAALDPVGSDAQSSLVTEPVARLRIDQSGAARRLDELVARIRALPPTEQFSHPAEFLGSPSLASLMPPPDVGPIVILNASRWRCDALVVSSAGIAVVPLQFSQSELAKETNRYLTALRRNTGPARDPELEVEANQVLEWLWDRVAEPVLDHLGFEPRQSDLPRIWWCPTGPLTLLPIHAAGYHDRDGGSTVLDRAISSYTPTLRALAHARSRIVPDRDPAPLLVSIADTPGPFAKLPGVEREQRLLTDHFGVSAVTSLSEADATRDAIIAGIGAHSMVHIASHGVQDLSRPAEGGLVPFDWESAGLIRVDDLAQITPGPRSLAFLSACQTATGGAVNLDEAMSFAAAMQYVGWPHVIGTLWTVFDGAAAAVAERFYRQVIRDGRIDLSTSAFALHEAVHALRAEAPRDAAYWARFVHLGP